MRNTTLCALLAILPSVAGAQPADPAEILKSTGVSGGFIVHLGCGDGKLTAGLRQNESYLVQGLDADSANVKAARAYLLEQGVYGPVSIDRYDSHVLPYIDNLVNLIVIDDENDGIIIGHGLPLPRSWRPLDRWSGW